LRRFCAKKAYQALQDCARDRQGQEESLRRTTPGPEKGARWKTERDPRVPQVRPKQERVIAGFAAEQTGSSRYVGSMRSEDRGGLGVTISPPRAAADWRAMPQENIGGELLCAIW